MINYSKYLQCLRKDTIFVSKPIQAGKRAGVQTYSWSEEKPLQANLNPAGGTVIAAEYGLDVKDMCIAYTDIDVPAALGDGVRVYALPGSEPDFTVVGIRNWTWYWRLDLKRR